MSFKEIKPKVIIGVSLIVYVTYLIITLFVNKVFLPYSREVTPNTEVENLKIWGYRILFGKIFSWIAMFIIGLLVAKFTHKENRNYLNGVISSLLFTFYGIIFYIVRFGIENYNKYNNFFETIIWSALSGGLGFYIYKRLQLKRLNRQNTSDNTV